MLIWHLLSVICTSLGYSWLHSLHAVDGWDSFQGKEERFSHLELNVTAFVLAKGNVLLELPFDLRWVLVPMQQCPKSP